MERSPTGVNRRSLYGWPPRAYLMAAARRVRTTFPGAVSHRTGAASGGDRGLHHAAPTWSLGSRANKHPTARAAPFFAEEKACVLVLPPLPPLTPGFASKEILRLRMAAERRSAAEARPDAGRHAARVFLDHIPIPDGATISLYHPMRSELDTKPLAEALLERGFTIALPVTPPKRGPLTFRAFRDGDPLTEDRYGVMTPADSAPEVRPLILVTPLLAFTRDGARLGYGGGYYDRTLAALREEADILAVGYAFAAQQVERIPVSRRDEKLDWIVTEREAIEISGPWGRR